MYVLLPDRTSNLDALVASLDGQQWEHWMAQFREAEKILVLPKFRFEYDVDLAQPLSDLGIGIAFDPSRADFSGLAADRLAVSMIKHKTFVELNEAGTEAAAVTGASMAGGAPPAEETQVIVDRPFFVAIRDDRTGALLFLGSIVDPQPPSH